MGVVVYCGMVHCVRRWSQVLVLPREVVRVAVRVHRHRVLAPAPPAVARRRHTSELSSEVGSLPSRFLTRTALLVHVRVVFARVVFCWIEVRVGVELYVEAASVEEVKNIWLA